MAIKKEVNHSNNKERCSAGNLDDSTMKVLQIKVHRLKVFGCSFKLLANVQCTSTRK